MNNIYKYITMEKIMLTLLIILITGSEALGQFILSLYHHALLAKKTHYIGIPIYIFPFITWLLYGVCTFLLLHSYKYTTMGKAEVYWDALSALVVPVIGYMYFSNKINTFGFVGIVFIIFGTLILGHERLLQKRFFHYL
jgi:multidrug transporter EmrE-like cation transporter